VRKFLYSYKVNNVVTLRNASVCLRIIDVDYQVKAMALVVAILSKLATGILPVLLC